MHSTRTQNMHVTRALWQEAYKCWLTARQPRNSCTSTQGGLKAAVQRPYELTPMWLCVQAERNRACKHVAAVRAAFAVLQRSTNLGARVSEAVVRTERAWHT